MFLDKIKGYTKRFWHWPVLVILAGGFFVATSSFNFYLQKNDFVKWISPDETANYTFAKLYAQTGSLEIFEKYNLYVGEIIHPRSFRSDFGYLKPVSFLGLPLIFGTIGKIFTYKALPYLTPFFGSVAIIFYYLLVRRIFSRSNALISAFVMAFFPVMTYYSARSMFHNVLFVSLLIIGLYFLVLMGDGRRENAKFDWRGFLSAMFAGLFIGLAAITRSSELLWIAPLLFFLWSVNIRNVGVFKLIVFLSFFFLAILPNLYWNQILYGGLVNGGYPEMNKSIAEIKTVSADMAKTAWQFKFGQYKALASRLMDNIFVFGFHPRDSWRTFNSYFIRMFPWLFWPSAVGFVSLMFSWKKLQKKHFIYIVGLMVISTILVLYYGSWKFNDNPDPSMTTIGNSYTRYWLPVYLGAIPFLSLLIIRLTDYRGKAGEDEAFWRRVMKKSATAAGRVAAVAIAGFISVIFLLYGSNEGLVETYKIQRAAKADLDKVLQVTEKNATIITRYHDKLFFPERKVIIGNFDDKNMIALYARLARKLPLYYYNFAFSDKDIDYLNARKLGEAGLSIEEIRRVNKEFALYKLSPAETLSPLAKK